MNGRYVVIGVTSTRNAWFSDVTRWTTSGVIAAEYSQAISIDEVRAVLGSGRKVSAVLAGATTHGLDRDFIALTSTLGVAVIIVAGSSDRRDWDSLGVAATLTEGFTPDELRDLLDRHAEPIEPNSRRSSAVSASIDPQETLAPLVAVTGAGGSGVSTMAMALATGLGARTDADDEPISTALADLTRTGDLAMYHDVGDVIPGLPELVEAHRGDTPDPSAVRELLFDIPDRPYDLLLGQRRSRDSAAMAPLSTAAAIDGLRRSYATVVVDVDPTIDGEAETGSVEIEHFNSAQRHALAVASVVVVVSSPGMRGVRRLANLLSALDRFRIPAARVLPIWNHAPRRPPSRASLTRFTAEINPMDEAVHPPLFIKHVRLLEDVHHSVGRLPVALVESPTRAVLRILEEHGLRGAMAPQPTVKRSVIEEHVGAA